MLKQHHPGQPATQQDSDHAQSAVRNLESTHCTDSNTLLDSVEVLADEWHAALDVQPSEASPAVQLSGCWTEARPGMPSAVTRSQLRAPAWRPARGAMPAHLQGCAPSALPSAVPHAANPQLQSSHSDQGSSEAEGRGPQASSLACKTSGTVMSPLAWMPEVAASQAELPSSRASFKREETPFFTPVAALPKPEPRIPPCSSSASTIRVEAALGRRSDLLQVGTSHATADAQLQSHTEASPDVKGRSEPKLNSDSCGSSSSCALSSRRAGSSHQQLQEDLSRQEDAARAGTSNTGPYRAMRVSADPVLSSSSSRDSWETDMAECGSSGGHPLPFSIGCSSALKSSELQQTPPRQRVPEQALTSAPSSTGECATPNMAGHTPLSASDHDDSWQAFALVQDTESSCQAAVQGRAYSTVHSLADSSIATCRAAQPPAANSMQGLIPMQRALALAPADNAHSSPAQPASAVQPPSRGLQDSSHEDLTQDSVAYGSCPSSRAGKWGSDSRFWEAPAGALPGQATQSPLPCGRGVSALLGSSAGPKACAQTRDPENVSGKQAHACLSAPITTKLFLTFALSHRHHLGPNI